MINIFGTLCIQKLESDGSTRGIRNLFYEKVTPDQANAIILKYLSVEGYNGYTFTIDNPWRIEKLYWKP